MAQLNTEPQQDPQSVNSVAADDPQSVMMSRLRALKTEASDSVADHPRRHLWWIGAGLAGALLIFLVAAVWRLAVPSDTRLDGGWIRVVDRQWGFQIDLPDWYQKKYIDAQSVQYTSRNMQVQVYDWKRKNFKPATAATELATIVSNERRVRPVKIVEDRSNDLGSPMIDFISTCGQAGGYQWTVRERVLIQQEVMIRVRVTRPEELPPADIQRLIESIRWLK